MGVKYTEEQINWLNKNSRSYNSYRDLRNDFNKLFGTSKTVPAIQQYLTKILKIQLMTEKKSHIFTSEEEDWITNNYHKFMSYSELTSEFNQRFEKNKTIKSIREKCTKRMDLSGMPNSGLFQNGHIQEQCPIGTIRKASFGTYIKVKDSMSSHISGYAEPYWIPIQKKIWQDHYGEVPEGKMVIFLDGDRENLDIENLYCIDRRISAIMATNKWYTNSREHTLTAIKWCELHYAMKDSVRR